METGELKELFVKLLSGDIEDRELRKFLIYLGNLLKKAGNHLSGESENNILDRIAILKGYRENFLEDTVQDFVCHLLSKKKYFMELAQEERGLKSYLWTSARNFLIDTYRTLSRGAVHVRAGEIVKEEEVNQEEVLDILSKETERIRSFEMAELESLILSVISQEEIKYLCYALDSKRYSCLWGSRSKDAIYKDVSRKKGDLFKRIGEALRSAEVDEELFQEFIKVRLSGWCEELRSKYCEEDKG